MELRIFTEPQQGATYDDLLAVALEAERLGFGAFFRSDHYRHMGDGGPGPGSTDAWTTLAGLAGACGPPAEVVDRLGAFGDVGADRIYLQVLDLTDLDHLRLVAEGVLPALA